MESAVAYAAMALSAMCAGIVQRTTGFGFGIFLIPLLTLLSVCETYIETISLSTMLAGTLCLVTVIRLWRYVRIKAVCALLAIFVPVSYLSGEYLLSLKTESITIILGVTLIALSIYFTFFQKDIKLKVTKFTTAVCATVSGVMGGMFSMQGPPIVLYFLATEKNKESYMAQCQCFFLCGNLFMTIHRASNGIITANVLTLYSIAIFGTLVGLFVGEKVFDRMPADKLKRIIFAYLAVSGIIILTGA